MRNPLLTIAATALAGGLALGVQAQDEPQGLYSANDIMGAEVLLAGSPDEVVGDVDDILLDDEMTVSSLVVESGAILGLGGREIIVEAGQFRLETRTEGDGVTVHRVLVEATAEEMEEFPTYDRDWMEQARENARSVWETTREEARSAWQRTRDAVSGEE
jgi:hypothetical protein